jgi:sulfoxide reductase heme-binding subunit YedZ
MKEVIANRCAKAGVFLVCLLPCARVAWDALRQELGANPIEFITHATGDWALRFLLITLAVTPMKRIFRLPQLARYRRMLGLFAFFYASLHFLTYLWLDKFFDLADIFGDIAKRPSITIGFTT